MTVRDPSRDDGLLDAIALRDGAVATSGGYERSYDPERRFHHIINPASGRSPTVARSVSVVAPTALAADALATTIFVLAPDAGMRLIESLPDCAGFLVPEGGAPRRSRRWSGLKIGLEAVALRDALRAAPNVVFQLGHQNRQVEAHMKAREVVEAGILGPVTLVETTTNRND